MLAQGRTFKAIANYNNTRPGFSFRETGGSSNYINDVNNVINYWVNGSAFNDYGSSFNFEKVELPFASKLAKCREQVQAYLSNASAKVIFTEGALSSALEGLNALEELGDNDLGVLFMNQIMDGLYKGVNNRQVSFKCPAKSNKYLEVWLQGETAASSGADRKATHTYIVKGFADGENRYLTITHAGSGRKFEATPASGFVMANLTAGRYDLKLISGENTQVAITCKNSVDPTQADWRTNGQYDRLQAGAVSAIGDGTWTIEDASVYTAQNFLDAAKGRFTDAKAQPNAQPGSRILGTALGQYHYSDAYNAANNNQLTSVDAIEQVVRDMYSKAAYLINTPAQKFVRIQTYNTDMAARKYVSSAITEQRLSLVSAATDNNTIFYWSNDNKLVAYMDGKTVGLNSEGAYGGYAATVDYAATGANITFQGSPGQVGTYNITLNNARALAIGTATNKVDAAGVTNGFSDTNAGYRFLLEEVTTLPVTIGTAGYSTFFAPLAMSAPEGVKVYVATQNAAATSLKLTQVVGNKIPAGTAVILQGEPGAIDLTVLKNETVPALAVQNDLKGGAAPTAIASGMTGYVLKLNTNEFSRFTPTHSRGFRAFVEVATSNGTQGLSFMFDDLTTAIENALIEANDAPVYDLSGRRVVNRVSGSIYLQNGKKFVQP